MRRTCGNRGFTLIEMLTVIGVMMVVMALALPNFVAMMKSRKWDAAVARLQLMVIRARALATNVRRDFSVEFDITDDGTRMWLESEVNDLERIPDLWTLQHEVGGYPPLLDFMKTTFREAGGTYTSSPPLSEFTCAACGHQWSLYGYYNPGAVKCPSCGHGNWDSYNYMEMFWYDFAYNPANADNTKYADNARQSEDVPLSRVITIDLTRCSDFVSWDQPNADQPYGKDTYRDIRIAPNGTLVQTREPVICLKERYDEQRLGVTVVRCTGRVVRTRLP